MPEFLTAEGDVRLDDRDDTLFTSGLPMMMINNNNNNIRFSTSGASSSSSTTTTIVSHEIEEIWEEEEEDQKEISNDQDDDDDQRNYWIHYNDTRSSNFNIRDRIPATIKEMEFEGMSNASGSYDSNNIYVAVGKGSSSSSSSSSSSMDALRWTLENLVNSPSNFIYLIHVFPEIRLIPSPLGMLPKQQVTPLQVESYTRQQTAKRMESLQKFMNLCSVYKVKVDTMLIESDNTAKAVLDLILILNIRRLVMGTTKSGLSKLRKKNGIGGQILKNASDTCDIKVICEGKQVIMTEQLLSFSGSSPSRPSSSSSNSNESINIDQITTEKKKNKANNDNGHHQQQEDDNEPIGSRSVSPPPCGGCFPTRF